MKRGMLLSCLRTTRLLGSLAIRWKEPTHMSTISSMYTPSYISEKRVKPRLRQGTCRPFTEYICRPTTYYQTHKCAPPPPWKHAWMTYNESSGGTRHGPSSRLLVSSVEKLPNFGNNSTGAKNGVVLIAKSKVTNQTYMHKRIGKSAEGEREREREREAHQEGTSWVASGIAAGGSQQWEECHSAGARRFATFQHLGGDWWCASGCRQQHQWSPHDLQRLWWHEEEPNYKTINKH